jgi:ParD-like antitoxin of type II bacterial toxin-antitoxin system
MADRMTRFDSDLFDAALDEGRRENRSGRQQLEHWTRIGQMFSAHETATRRRIAAAVRGDVPLSTLSTDERLVANLELDVAIRERTAGASFGRALLKAGVTAVALDDDGALVEFRPDGSRQPVDAAAERGRAVHAG